MQNLYNQSHICNSQAYRDGYDIIVWDNGEYVDTAEEHVCCGECKGECECEGGGNG